MRYRCAVFYLLRGEKNGMRKTLFLSKIRLLWLVENNSKFFYPITLNAKNISLNKITISDFGFILQGLGYVRFPLLFLYNAFAVLFRGYICMVTPSISTYYTVLRHTRGYIRWLQILLAGQFGRFRTSLYLYGLGKRILEEKRYAILLTLGFSHEVVIRRGLNMRFKYWRHRKWKQMIRVVSTSLWDLRNSIFIFRRIRYPDCYNANGIRLLKQKIKLKPRKKWGVF